MVGDMDLRLNVDQVRDTTDRGVPTVSTQNLFKADTLYRHLDI